MKKAKRYLLIVFCVLFACACFVLSACTLPDDPVEEQGFKVTVAQYDTEQGTVSVSQPKEGALYDNGEKVTVTVTPANDCEVATFAVSGHNDAQLTEGKYEFEITADTTVTVTFQSSQPVAPKEGTVTVYYDEEFVSVTLEPQAENNFYAGGTEVTLFVTVNDGYVVSSIYAGNKEVHLAEGKYTFVVDGDVTFNVNAAQLFNEALLASLQGSVSFDGEFTETDIATNESYSSGYLTVFDEEQGAMLMQNSYMSRPTYCMLLKDVDGKAALVSHGEDGKVIYDVSDEDFALFANPFDALCVEDFSPLGFGIWEISDDELAQSVATAITGFYDSVTSFELLGDQTVEQIVIRAEIASLGLRQEYVFDVTIGATIPQEWLGDYTETAEHQALRDALAKAKQADSYTVHYHSEEVGYEDVDYEIFYTPQGIYENLVDWESGCLERVDGNVWQYSYDPQTQTFEFLTDFYKNATISQFGADFEVQGVNYALLESKGDGVFELRLIDAMVEQHYTLFAGYFAQYFAIGPDEIRYFPSATTFRIELSDGVLDKVIFDYNYNNYIEERVTLQFYDFNNTQLPIDIPESALKGNIDVDFCGTWADDNYIFKLNVNLDGITVNGADASDITALQQGGYRFKVDGVQYSLTKQGDALTLTDNIGSYLLHSAECPWIDFVGTYTGKDGNGTSYSAVIGERGLTVIKGDDVFAIQEFEFGFEYSQANEVYFYTFDFVLNGAHAFLYQNVNQANQFVYGEEYEDETQNKTVVLTFAECKWTEFVGTYAGTDDYGHTFNVVITAVSVFVTCDGVTYTAVITDYDNYEGFWLLIDGQVMCIANAGYGNKVDSIAFMKEDPREYHVELERTN